MSEWKKYMLGDVINLKRGYDLPNSQRKKGAVPIISSSGITDYHNKAMRNAPGVITGRYGTVGQVFFAKEDYWPLNTTLYVQDFKGNYPQFIFYLLKNFDFDKYSDKSAVPGINRNDVHTEVVLIPGLNEQIQTANILSSLDDKIELLLSQNKTIELLAATLFRQWFVEDVEDYWEPKRIKDVCVTITKGTTPTTLGKQYKESGVNFIKAESLTDLGTFIPEKFAFIDDETDEILKRSRIQTGDILITIAGTIGRIGYVTDEILPANTNQAIGIMRANTNLINPYFLYCLFNTTEVRNDLDGRVVHAVQPNLSLSQIGDIEFKMPAKEKLEHGMNELQTLFEKKNKNTIQINTLTQLRDTLLPKLMSGEVRIDTN